jgi:hypothetical protein
MCSRPRARGRADAVSRRTGPYWPIIVTSRTTPVSARSGTTRNSIVDADHTSPYTAPPSSNSPATRPRRRSRSLISEEVVLAVDAVRGRLSDPLRCGVGEPARTRSCRPKFMATWFPHVRSAPSPPTSSHLGRLQGLRFRRTCSRPDELGKDDKIARARDDALGVSMLRLDVAEFRFSCGETAFNFFTSCFETDNRPNPCPAKVVEASSTRGRVCVSTKRSRGIRPVEVEARKASGSPPEHAAA